MFNNKKRIFLVAALIPSSVFAGINVSVMVTKNVNKCHTGDSVALIKGDSNVAQIQRGNCSNQQGRTGDQRDFMLWQLPDFQSFSLSSGDQSVKVPTLNKTTGFTVAGDAGTTYILLSLDEVDEQNAHLNVYTKMPWAGQQKWTERFSVPVQYNEQDLSQNIPVGIASNGKVQLVFGPEFGQIGEGENNKMLLSLDAFDPTAQ
ncbi:MAG: hypothetical protein WD055_00395 [Candidatus Dependentiae bacterium]